MKRQNHEKYDTYRCRECGHGEYIEHPKHCKSCIICGGGPMLLESENVDFFANKFGVLSLFSVKAHNRKNLCVCGNVPINKVKTYRKTKITQKNGMLLFHPKIQKTKMFVNSYNRWSILKVIRDTVGKRYNNLMMSIPLDNVIIKLKSVGMTYEDITRELLNLREDDFIEMEVGTPIGVYDTEELKKYTISSSKNRFRYVKLTHKGFEIIR